MNKIILNTDDNTYKQVFRENYKKRNIILVNLDKDYMQALIDIENELKNLDVRKINLLQASLLCNKIMLNVIKYDNDFFMQKKYKITSANSIKNIDKAILDRDKSQILTSKSDYNLKALSVRLFKSTFENLIIMAHYLPPSVQSAVNDTLTYIRKPEVIVYLKSKQLQTSYNNDNKDVLSLSHLQLVKK